MSAPENLLPEITPAMLAIHDGSVPGRPVLVACEGKVYDVSRSTPWFGGVHWACATAGRDQTGLFLIAPHGREVFDHVPLVGRLVEE